MITTGLLYPPAFVSRSFASPKGGGSEPIEKAAAQAILTAIDGGLFTCTVATSGLSHVEKLIRQLGEIGYTTSLSGTTLTVNW